MARLAESSPVGLYILQRGCFQYVNPWLAEQLGYAAPEHLIGHRFWDWVHPEDRRLVRLKPCLHPQEGSLRQPAFFRMRTAAGQTIWVHMAVRVTRFNGRLAGIGFLIDVATILAQAGALQEELQRYQTILDDVDVPVSEIDFQGNLTYINDTGCRVWDLPREKLMGLNYRAYMKAADTEKFIEIYKNVYRTGKPVKNLVFDVRDKDNRPRTIEKSISPIRDVSGNISGFRMVTRDITEQKEAQTRLAEQRSRLEAIFASVNDAIITVDPELRVIEANKSTEQICGLPVAAIAGQGFSHCRSQCDCGRSCMQILKQTINTKVAIREHMIECDHQKRHHQLVSVSTSPLLDPAGKFMGAVMVIRDMTRLTGLERELRERSRFQNIIGRSKSMQSIYRLLEDLANIDTTVLITGESGTGKELVARALHYGGHRAFKPFISVNCAALAENLLESELFGHVKGAFTGAIKDKQGRFQAADGGTILLDEIGDISPCLQIKLLRVLQEKEFERVGEAVARKVDVRIIACTNQELKEKVRQGEFRQDLYYRLKVVEVVLPPLRERLEDLPLLVEHFLEKFNERFGKKVEGISKEVLNAFMNYSWPGNVRELEHVMEHAFVLCHGGAITMQHLPVDIRHYDSPENQGLELRRSKGAVGAQQIKDALVRTGGNKAKAARLLGIGRRTIYRKIEEYQIQDRP
ncbi:MAG: sigma 54-interacting transcriptional regulator [Desulfobacteraceae bacterium]|nr:sigma 54-interacting transcriptional regulator [Desulfobacteraceae bacterium]